MSRTTVRCLSLPPRHYTTTRLLLRDTPAPHHVLQLSDGFSVGELFENVNSSGGVRFPTVH